MALQQDLLREIELVSHDKFAIKKVFPIKEDVIKLSKDIILIKDIIKDTKDIKI